MTDSSQPSTPMSDETSSSPFAHLKSLMIALVIIFAIVFASWGGLTLAAEIAQKQIQKEYLALTDDASRAIFVKRHAHHPLGGLVLLGEANDYYAQGDYAAAKSAYSQATHSGLKAQPILLQEAMLGLAFSTYMLNPDQGLKSLKEIAQNSELMEATRAHAASELAGYWIEKGDWQQAKSYIQLINTFKYVRTWQRHVAALSEIYPQLAMKSPSNTAVK